MVRGGRKGRKEEPKRTRGNKRTRKPREGGGARSPSYSGPGLPDYCQVTVGWSLDIILTGTIYPNVLDTMKPTLA